VNRSTSHPSDSYRVCCAKRFNQRLCRGLRKTSPRNKERRATARHGQEALITFLGGDIDRPVIVGSLYNGQGADNAQSNQVQQGAANATGNAPMWFPGDQEASGKQGKLPGHAHNQVLSGIKTQALSTSQTGQGGYNQIVFDDSPGQSRLGLQSHGKQSGSHAGETELNLGALRQQTDNQRLGTVGYGFELKTHFSGAIRSGSGLLISADKRQGNESGSSSHQMDSNEATSQLQTGQDLIKALTETAQQHKAMLPVLKTTEAKPDKLPAYSQLEHNGKVLQAKASGADAGEGGGGGGGGETPAYSDPLMVLSAPAGIALLTPQSASFNAGTTTSIAAGQDINLLAQANAAHSVKAGISLFTYGKASNPKKPNQEVGISLHAASGKVSSQSQSDKTQITADKGIQVNSTTDAVSIQAPKHVLLTAQGAYIKMSGGNIEVHAPGKVDFKASMKSWTGAKSSSITPLNLTNGPLRIQNWIEINHRDAAGAPLAGQGYKIFFEGGVIIQGKLDAKGHARHEDVPEKAIRVEYEPRKPEKDKPWDSFDKVLAALPKN
jgi:type VI secretion system secreted protein VgrG